MANAEDLLGMAKAQAAPNEEHRLGALTLPSGRHIFVSFPMDMTVYDLLHFAAWVTTTLRTEVEKARMAVQGSALIVRERKSNG